MCDLDRMVEYVLAVGGSVVKSSEEAYKLVIKTVYIGFENGSVTLLLHDMLYLTASLVDHFFDTGRVNSTVCDKLFKCDTGNLTASLIEAGKRDSFGCIVDDKVNTRKRFECLYVSALTSDDPALHFVIRQRNNGNCGFGYLICGAF